MRKLFMFLSLVLFLFFVTCAYADEDEPAFVQQKNLGRDRAGLQWWLTEFGTASSGYYAVAREYYTNEDVKADTVNALSSRYGVPYERAEAIYFAEYRFEYTSDGGQCAEISRVFYDMLGEEVCGYRTGHKVFNPITSNTVQSKGAAYAMGKIK